MSFGFSFIIIGVSGGNGWSDYPLPVSGVVITLMFGLDRLCFGLVADFYCEITDVVAKRTYLGLLDEHPILLTVS
jgi:hypothetical protein